MSSSNAQNFMGDDLELGLKIFTGSAIEAFRSKCFLFEPSTADSNNAPDRPSVLYQQSLPGGGATSAQFLMYSDLPDPEEHDEGDELMGQQFELADGEITLDKPVVAHVDVPERHLELAQVNPLIKLGRKLGYSLARNYDLRLFRLAALGARKGSLTKNGLNIHNGATRVERVGADLAGVYTVDSTGALRMRQDIEGLALGFDEKDVPETGRNLFIDPYLRRVALQDTTIFDVRYNNNENENELNVRAIGEIAGFKIFVANQRIPSTNFQTGPAKYRGDFRYNGSGGGRPVMLAMCNAGGDEAGIGTLIVKGVITEMTKDIRRGTRFMKARIHMGADIMHPWFLGAVEVDDA